MATFSQNLTALESNISTLLSLLATKDDLTNLLSGLSGSELTALNDAITTINNTLTTHGSDISTIKTDIINIKSANNSQDSAIITLQQTTAALQGQINYRGVYDFLTASPTSTELTNYVIDIRGKVSKGDTIINTFNNDEWYYDGTNWANLGQSMVVQATNSNLGIVKGSTADSGVNIAVDGEMNVPVINAINTTLESINTIIMNATT